MPTKKYKPTSPGRRFMSVSSFEGVTTSAPQRQLVEHLKKHSGRNASGRITVRHQGGGHKKTYRLIDFKRQKDGVPGKVTTIEYDPNRSARIALVVYADGDKRYILSPHGLSAGDVVSSGESAEVRPGCALPMLVFVTRRFWAARTLVTNSRTRRETDGRSDSAAASLPGSE